MKKNKLALLLMITICALKVHAQDPHFSQYFASPLTLNPAMTGKINGDHRLSTNFRNQWWSTGNPFLTNTISYDTKIMQDRIPEDDIMGAGILALYDQAMSGGYKNINVSASMAYHKALGMEGSSKISAGFQLSYGTRVLDYSKLDFSNQFNGLGFDTNIPSNESFGINRKSYVDVNTGVLYTYETENTDFYIGGSVYHITRPNISFLQDADFRLPMRYTIHGGSNFAVGEEGNEIFVGGLYMEQGGVSEKSFGVAFGQVINEDAIIYGGSWIRLNDAVMPYLGLNYKNLQVGLSFDAVTSKLRKANPKNGSFELSLNYLIKTDVNHYNTYKGKSIF